MTEVDYLNNGLEFKQLAAEEEEEVEQLHDLGVAKKNAKVDEQCIQESTEVRKRKIWLRKSWRRFFFGFIHFATLCIFVVLTY